MSRTITSNAEFLRALHVLKPLQRKVLLKTADANNILCLCECVYNTLKGKIPLTRTQRVRLSGHKHLLRRLVKRGENINKKKRILVQSGGAFLPLILAPLITGVLSSLFR